MNRNQIAVVFLLSWWMLGCKGEQPKTFEENIQQIKQVVAVYMENHSFDNLFGEFEGANGLANAKEENIIQVDEEGEVYEYLPDIPRNSSFPKNMENYYFNIDQYVPSDQPTPDPLPSFYYQQQQINGGKMDKFAAYNTSKGMTMGYYTTEDLPLYPLAKEYTLCDNFFHSGFGDSYFNHVFLIAAAPAEWKDAPDHLRAELDSAGMVVKNEQVSPDGYVIGFLLPEGGPYPSLKDQHRFLPPQTMPTIGDRMNEKGVSWAWYSAGWDSAVVGKPSNYAYNHEPFVYFENFGPETEAREKHLKDETDYLEAARSGTLPNVSFVKPGRGLDEHPGSASVLPSEEHAVKLINAALEGP